MANIYATLSNTRLLGKSYSLKFLFVAFLGIHIPLIVLAICLGLDLINLQRWTLILSVLSATLLATAITLYILRRLLWPLDMGVYAMQRFYRQNQVPNLPMNYPDEAGQLLKYTQLSIDKVNKASEQQQLLLSLLNHDLRTPSAQAVSIARLVRDEPDSDQVRQMADILEANGLQMLDLLTNLTVLFRNEDGQAAPTQQPVLPILKEAMAQVAASFALKDVTLHAELELSSAVTVKCQTVMLRQAIVNLLSNAVKFSQPGQSVCVKATVDKSSQLRLAIADQGLGFDEDTRQKLFDKFTKAGRRGTKGEVSSGIGLYLSRQIVQASGGSLEAQSEGANKGATFTITLPVAA